MAALTRAILGTILKSRIGTLMEAVSFAVTTAGANADLDDPLAWATRRVGGTTASFSTTTDAEIAAVSSDEYEDLVDLAEYRTLQNILGNLDNVDITAGPRSEKLSQLADQVRGMIDSRQDFADSFVRPVTAGYISMGFAEHGE